MKISELAAITACTVETVRYYEAQGLLMSAARNDANYRVYQTAHLERLKFIRHSRSLGLSLSDISVLLKFKDSPDQPCDGVNDLIAHQIVKVDDQIKGLESLKKQLLDLRQQCHAINQATDCGILHALSDTRV